MGSGNQSADELSSRQARILVVAGEAACRSFVARTLESVLLEVDTASRFEEALERLESQRYAVLVLDPTLPRIDGLELLKKIHEDRSGLAGRTVLIVEPGSAVPQKLDGRTPCRQIQKPVLRHELIQAVSECLREPCS